MTNAEKFKEDWGFEPNVIHCPKIGRESCMVCPYAEKCFEECASDWWNSEYKGEPTIPLSVIEKITETMEAEYASADELADWFSDGDKTEASFYRGKASGIKWVKGIINNTVSEVTHGKD